MGGFDAVKEPGEAAFEGVVQRGRAGAVPGDLTDQVAEDELVDGGGDAQGGRRVGGEAGERGEELLEVALQVGAGGGGVTQQADEPGVAHGDGALAAGGGEGGGAAVPGEPAGEDGFPGPPPTPQGRPGVP